MKNKIVTTVLVLSAFLLGFNLKGMITKQENVKARVSGIGGIFFKCKNPTAVREWYKSKTNFNHQKIIDFQPKKSQFCNY